MYNLLMRDTRFQVRICNTCGLRYPLIDEKTFEIRCPACLGETRLALQRTLTREATRPSLDMQIQARMSVLLDNIRSAGNVGSILRSAEGFGFAHAHLCGITPTPENDAVKKTALGAEDSVTWSYHKDAVKLVKGLKVEGWKVFGLEEGNRASSIREMKNPEADAVLIVGNEITGVDPELLSQCDRVFTIPMQGEKKSFNVAVAFGIAAYALATPR